MKRTLILAIFAVLVMFSGVFANPMFFDVWANGGLLGTIEAFSADMTAEDYYNYYSASGHPDENGGPTPAAFTSNIWMYYGTDGLSFNFIHGADGEGSPDWNHVEWDLNFLGMDYGILFTDDGTPENEGEEGMVDFGGGYILADFAYRNNSDGGIVGIDPLDCCNWLIGIDTWSHGDITAYNFASADGSYLSGYDGADGSFPPSLSITPHCVPEPGTLILLGLGLLGAGAHRRKKNK